MRRPVAIAIIAALLLALFVIAAARQKRPEVMTTAEIHAREGIPVRVAQVTIGDVSDTLEVTGDIKSHNSATLSAKVSGRIVSVSGREGDAVAQGATVVQLDQQDALAAVQQARAGLESAQARLSQARTAARVQTTQSSASIEQAQASLTAAQARLAMVRKGARSQELLIAESGVATAKANLDNAEANLRRHRILHEQGAISAAQFDVAQTQYNVAQSQHNAARQQLSLVKEGARSEEIQQAETQVRQAEEALRMARANAAQNQLRREDIKAAEAGVCQARAAVNLAEQQVANTRMTSPFNGFISSRMTQPGQMASPGVPLVEIVDVSTVYFEATISERSYAQVKPGQPVRVSVDAFGSSASSGRAFMGRVERIYPSGSTHSRSFLARIAIPNPGGELRPGMFARGSIQISERENTLLVPLDAVIQRNGRNLAFTIANGVVTSHSVERGAVRGDLAEILLPTSLKPGDEVVVSGHKSLEDGVRVYVAN